MAEDKLRRAGWEDAQILFDWVNEDEVRANSFSPEPVQWQGHLDWFKQRLDSSSCVILIFERSKVPMGQARFDLNNKGQWEIDYSIDTCYRGQGLGKKLISLAIQFLREAGHKEPILAKVKVNNPVSLRVFRNQRFSEELINNVHVFTLS